MDYFLSLFLNSKSVGKAAFILGILLNVAMLGYFKYANFFVEEFSGVFGFNPDGWAQILLPLGVSFFTFHKISYLADVYRGIVTAEKNPINYALYIMLFPQLIAGPIIKYAQIEKQIAAREHGFERFFEGVYTFIMGLSMKVLIADPLGQIHGEFTGMTDPGSAAILVGILAFTFQIYFDFAGYSGMAIGLGRMFGFEFPENFNRPYLSRSITEFWRRWHMTLSGFFKEYIYIPLGGSREGSWKMVRNLFLVFLFTGIWHGADWHFFLWGVYFGVIIIMEKLFLGRLLEKLPGFLAQTFTFILVFLGWILFQAKGIGAAWENFTHLFAFKGAGLEFVSLSPRNIITLLIAAVLSFVAFEWQWLQKLGRKDTVRVALMIFLLANCFLAVAGDTYHPFLYFRF